MKKPIINVTMPVFNRHDTTRLALLALRKCSQVIPFSITVVDNGSEPELVQALLEFKQIGLIDKLFLLEKNMGTACAANIGWEMTNAPIYMKLDNDIVIQDKDFFRKIWALWAHGEPLSNLGNAEAGIAWEEPGLIRTPDGLLKVCAKTLIGQAIFVPKSVSDILGFWSEDYGLYGAEDGDYGLRMHCAGFKQYYYSAAGLFTDLGQDLQTTYAARNVDKKAGVAAAIADAEGGYGLFMVNQALYNLCVRTWRPVRKYLVQDVSSTGQVRLAENPEFAYYKELLDRCAQKINERVDALGQSNPDYIFTQGFIEELKSIMGAGGYDCETFLRQVDLEKPH